MDNFNLKKYLAEGKLNEDSSQGDMYGLGPAYQALDSGIQYYIDEFIKDINADIEEGADKASVTEYLNDLIKAIAALRDSVTFSPDLAEGRLLKEDGLSKLLLKVLKAYQPEVEQQLGTKLANWKLDDMDDASATDVDGLTGFSFKIVSELPMDFKGGGFGDDDTDPEIIDLANKKIAVIKYNL
jgi:hypothetical protein